MADEREGIEKSENSKITNNIESSKNTIEASNNLILTEERETRQDADDLSEDESESEGEEEENNDDSELIVLDPEHPLMQRFQETYKEHLRRQDEKLALEVKQLSKEQASCLKQREEVGVELYNVQQELARQQMLLEQHHDAFNEQTGSRKHTEQRLAETKQVYKTAVSDLRHQRKKASELQSEVENIASKILHLESAKDDVRSDISVMKRAAEKTESEVMKVQREKKVQDMLVNGLVTTVDRLRSDIEMYNAQLEAQREETKATVRTLTDAATELEAIELEKKQLLQQWNNSLIAMKKRDEAFAAIQKANNVQKQAMLATETELSGYKRQIARTQETNEQLTYTHNRIESDISQVKRLIASSHTKQEAVKIEYSTYSRTLHDTEQELNKSQINVNIKKSEITNIRKQIEKEFQEKIKVEDMIIGKIQTQLTVDKASKYTKKMTEKIRSQATQLERSVAEVENDISRNILQFTNSTSRARNLQDTLSNINEVMARKNAIITRVESDILKRNAEIEKKQVLIDQYSKKIDALITKEGDDMFVGPMELQIKTLQRQIEAQVNEILELQQYWLRQQGDLVQMLKQVSEQSTDVETKKKQSTILLQKKLRIEGHLAGEKTEIRDHERNIRSLQHDMQKLNTLIHKNHDKQETLQQDNILLENHFVATLKDAELESVQMQNTIDGLKEEKERLANALVESERQIMLWEKKSQLAREAREAVNSEIGNGEMHSMKAEIHRMEVRYGQLMRQQEKMVTDMEKTVIKRESIIGRSEARAKLDRSNHSKQQQLSRTVFHKNLNEMKRRIKSANKDAAKYDQEIASYRGLQQEIGNELETKQTNVQMIQQALEETENEIQLLHGLKTKTFNQTLSQQQRAKHYGALKEGKYKLMCKSTEALTTERSKQEEKYRSICQVVDRLNSEYPEMQSALRDVTMLLSDNHVIDDVTDDQ